MASEPSQSPPAPDQIYHTLRNRLLALDPQEVEIFPTLEHPSVWGVLMEFVLIESLVTLSALVDGTASLYFSSGGGIIGSGTHPSVGDASKRMVAVAEECLEQTLPVTECPLPKPHTFGFHLLTFNGPYSLAVPEDELMKKTHPLYPLYAAGQELITRIRLIEESRRKE